MSQALDPVTQHHIDQAADRLAERVRRDLLRGDDRPLHRASRSNMLEGARINVFVPVLAHRFARERLRRSPRPKDAAREGPAGGAVRLRPQRRAQPDGRRARQAALAGPDPRALPPARAPAEEIDPAVVEAMNELGVDIERGVPEAADRRGRARRGRRDHDGLRRRLPDLSGQALRGLGARRSRRPRPRHGAHASATRSTGASAPCWASCCPRPRRRPDGSAVRGGSVRQQVRVGINGFGRMGRLALRAGWESPRRRLRARERAARGRRDRRPSARVRLRPRPLAPPDRGGRRPALDRRHGARVQPRRRPRRSGVGRAGRRDGARVLGGVPVA